MGFCLWVFISDHSILWNDVLSADMIVWGGSDENQCRHIISLININYNGSKDARSDQWHCLCASLFSSSFFQPLSMSETLRLTLRCHLCFLLLIFIKVIVRTHNPIVNQHTCQKYGVVPLGVVQIYHKRAPSCGWQSQSVNFCPGSLILHEHLCWVKILTCAKAAWHQINLKIHI